MTDQTMTTQDTLLAYSEWLDGEGIILPNRVFVDSGGETADDRSHDQLAAEFIAQWGARTGTAPLAGSGPSFPAAVERDEHDDTSTVGHRLIVDVGDCDLFAVCECGQDLGHIRPNEDADRLVLAWESHVMGGGR